MSKEIEFTSEELELIVEAIQDAMVFRDSRSRVIQRAVRMKGSPRGETGEADLRKSREYEALMRKLARPE
jgi:hypothetical protein